MTRAMLYVVVFFGVFLICVGCGVRQQDTAANQAREVYEVDGDVNGVTE